MAQVEMEYGGSGEDMKEWTELGTFTANQNISIPSGAKEVLATFSDSNNIHRNPTVIPIEWWNNASISLELDIYISTREYITLTYVSAQIRKPSFGGTVTNKVVIAYR